MMRGKRRKRNNRGVTMVELIVTFALLAIFLTAATMCISHAVLNYYHERQMMASYSVVDMVLSEIKDEVRTMQSSDYNGYVKLRVKDSASGKLIASSVPDENGIYTGTTLEFVVSNINDAAIALQIDAEGCRGTLINKDGVNDASWKDLPEHYLTLRYYNKYTAESDAGYKNLFMDQLVAGTVAADSGDYSLSDGSSVVWHAQEKLPVPVYQDLNISTEFSVKPEPDAAGNKAVRYVDVTVTVRNAAGEMVYSKKRRLDLQNNVYYRTTSTMYSDGAEAVIVPAKVNYTVEYCDTEGRSIRASEQRSGNAGDLVTGEQLKKNINGFSYTSYAGGGTLAADTNMTVRLIYTRVSYNINYICEHMSVNPNPDTYQYGIDPGTIQNPQMEQGYRFLGWFSDEAHTNAASTFADAEGFNSGAIKLYGAIESVETSGGGTGGNSTGGGNIDGMEDDDSGHQFSEDLDTPSEIDGFNADASEVSMKAVAAWEDLNATAIRGTLETALAPHGYNLEDVLVSTSASTTNNVRTTRMYVVEKPYVVLGDYKLTKDMTDVEIVETILSYLNKSDQSVVENVSIELDPKAVAVYESQYFWANGTESQWKKIEPEPKVYLHLNVYRTWVTWSGTPYYWSYGNYSYSLWFTEVQ